MEMPSKHFFKWGCTRSGSFVSERISSISSLDKKKKLERKNTEVVRCFSKAICAKKKNDKHTKKRRK